MIRLAKEARIDWSEIEQRLLDTAATHIADAARRRSGCAAAAIVEEKPSLLQRRIVCRDASLIRREEGDPTQAPRPFLSPSAASRRQLRDAIISQLEQDLS